MPTTMMMLMMMRHHQHSTRSQMMTPPPGEDNLETEETDTAALASDASDDDDLPSDEEIESMFDDVPDEREGVDSWVDPSQESPDDISLDDMPDDPIPEGFTTVIPKEKKKASPLKIAMTVLVILGGLLGGAYYAKDKVISMVPGAAALYEMAGLGGEEPGAGLEIRSVKFDKEGSGEKEVLVVWGSIANIVDTMRPVPLIKVLLFDAENEEIQSMILKPAKTSLKPGANIGFKARINDPSPMARRIQVMFIAPEKKAHDEKPAGEKPMEEKSKGDAAH